MALNLSLLALLNLMLLMSRHLCGVQQKDTPGCSPRDDITTVHRVLISKIGKKW